MKAWIKTGVLGLIWGILGYSYLWKVIKYHGQEISALTKLLILPAWIGLKLNVIWYFVPFNFSISSISAFVFSVLVGLFIGFLIGYVYRRGGSKNE